MRTAYGKRWYRPREIAKLGLIQSSSGTNNERGNYNFILELIRSGRLRAKDYSTGKSGRPFWLVPEDEVARYHETTTIVENNQS